MPPRRLGSEPYDLLHGSLRLDGYVLGAAAHRLRGTPWGSVCCGLSKGEGLRDLGAREPGDRWTRAADQDEEDAAATDLDAATAAALAAEAAAQAVIDTQTAVLTAARTVADAADAAALVVEAAVEARAAVVAAAVAAAARARRTEDQLRHDLLHDELTGVPTRRLLVDRLTQALARSTRSRTRVAVLFLDLDGFKWVNDTFGHAVGDQLLVGIAQTIQGCLRVTDTCARVGGDEFVVVCEELHDPSNGALVAGRIQARLAAGVTLGEQTIPVHVSVGIAISTAGALPLDLLDEADAAMYEAKRVTRQDPDLRRDG